ncbi:hypothetical protein K388_05597 [Streptomyces sp. KhCrAH-43]|uniref:hypothetical protein n=1 Tax=unclassified Streptomyces TaxID=2593676 RepID=UPI00035D2245|nr:MULTISPECIES: hypothetical protein [unclassified Streptomyces]MYX67346.1 hypothetical protein [Streptomyces sp. SID8373]RAJ53810.1 hypothetical protein K388_05597 [Streptomyces sp. KhCrAH-43]
MTAREDLYSVAAQDMPVDHNEVDEAIDAFARELTGKVRALHRPVEHRGRTICAECSAWAGGSTDKPPADHPCNTIKALGGQEAS